MAKSIGCDGRIVPLKVRTLKETCVVTYEVMTSQMASLLGTFAAFAVPVYALLLVLSCLVKQKDSMSEGAFASSVLAMTVLVLVPAIFAAAIVPRALAHITACHFLGQRTTVKETLQVSIRVGLKVLATVAALFFVIMGWSILMGLVFVLIFGAILVGAKNTYIQDTTGSASANASVAIATFFVAYGLFTSVLLLFLLYLRARYVFSFIVAAVEPRRWGFSALGRSAELMKGFYATLLLAVIGVSICEAPLFLLKFGVGHSADMTIKNGSVLWFLLTCLGMVVFVGAVIVVKAAVGVFFTVFYFSARCRHATTSSFDHETLAALIHGTEISGVEFGYNILGLQPEEELLNEKTLDP